MQPSNQRQAIAALPRELSPDLLAAVHALYDAEQQTLASRQPVDEVDLAYGGHERQRLDVYRAQGIAAAPAPVVIWVHGGGFMRGDKGSAQSWPNANAGRAFARSGFVGVTINYRLAPAHKWPAGGEDVLGALEWCRQNIAGYGGDPDRIVLAGTSAGAVHVATALQLGAAQAGICGAVLLSGLYGQTPYDDPRDKAYFGEESDPRPEWSPLAALVDSDVPLFVACAEFDPGRFQEEFVGLLQNRLARRGTTPRAWIGTGHNHFSLAYHLGTSDTRLLDELNAFIRDCVPRS